MKFSLVQLKQSLADAEKRLATALKRIADDGHGYRIEADNAADAFLQLAAQWRAETPGTSLQFTAPDGSTIKIGCIEDFRSKVKRAEKKA